jgi:hypothetical protein
VDQPLLFSRGLPASAAREAGGLLRAWFDKPGIPDLYRRAVSYAALA